MNDLISTQYCVPTSSMRSPPNPSLCGDDKSRSDLDCRQVPASKHQVFSIYDQQQQCFSAGRSSVSLIR